MRQWTSNGRVLVESVPIANGPDIKVWRPDRPERRAGKWKLPRKRRPRLPRSGERLLYSPTSASRPWWDGLWRLTGEQKGEDFRIRDGQNVIGSAPDADIVLRDTAVSGKHASLRYKDQKFFLTDLDSSNGTYLNDSPSSIAREELKDNDVVRIGEVSLKFKCF